MKNSGTGSFNTLSLASITTSWVLGLSLEFISISFSGSSPSLSSESEFAKALLLLFVKNELLLFELPKRKIN